MIGFCFKCYRLALVSLLIVFNFVCFLFFMQRTIIWYDKGLKWPHEIKIIFYSCMQIKFSLYMYVKFLHNFHSDPTCPNALNFQNYVKKTVNMQKAIQLSLWSWTWKVRCRDEDVPSRASVVEKTYCWGLFLSRLISLI